MSNFRIFCVTAALGALGVMVLLLAQPARAGGEVNLLTWEGFADPSFTSIFEEKTGCTVTATYIGNNEEIMAKLGATDQVVYDAVSPDIDAAGILVQMGVIEPLDMSRIERWDEMPTEFTEFPGVVVDGVFWAVPWAWGSIPIMYRPDKIKDPITSLDALFDPKYAGHVALQDDKVTLFLAARHLYGRDFDSYHMTDEQLAEVRDHLIEQKKVLRKYWSTAGELVSLYATGDVWLSTTWGGYQSALLADQGIEVVEVIPDDLADAWQNVWQIAKGTPNLDCAYRWVNFATSPDGQCGMVSVTGYAGANPVALDTCLTPEEQAAIHVGDAEYIAGLAFIGTLDRPDAYVDTFNAVKAAN